MGDRTASSPFPVAAPFRHGGTSDVGLLAQALRCLDDEDRTRFYSFLMDVVTAMPSFDPQRLQAEVEAKWAERGYRGPDLNAEPLPSASMRSVVYYIRFGDRVKIGTTMHLAKRLKALPFDEVLATEPGYADRERERHQQFAALRITGEWFRYEEPLRSHIEALQT